MKVSIAIDVHEDGDRKFVRTCVGCKIEIAELPKKLHAALDKAKAHTLAALLLPFVRRMIDGPTPLHLIEAPTAGSGKTLICKLIGLIVTGAIIEACTLPRSPDEMKKLITSELMNGRPVILLDNAVDKVDSASLASVLTAPAWTDRILGKTLMVTAQNLALWLLTANNPQLSMEIARRCVRVRIDSKTDQPWRRQKFRHKHIEEWTRNHRGELVHAVLTLIQAWVAAGKPIHANKLGSFETWSGVIGGILQVAGIPGFLGNLQALYEDADVDGQMWGVCHRMVEQVQIKGSAGPRPERAMPKNRLDVGNTRTGRRTIPGDAPRKGPEDGQRPNLGRLQDRLDI